MICVRAHRCCSYVACVAHRSISDVGGVSCALSARRLLLRLWKRRSVNKRTFAIGDDAHVGRTSGSASSSDSPVLSSIMYSLRAGPRIPGVSLRS